MKGGKTLQQDTIIKKELWLLNLKNHSIRLLKFRYGHLKRGGANGGSGGAPAPPTAVGPMLPLLSPSNNFLPWMHLRGEAEIIYR